MALLDQSTRDRITELFTDLEDQVQLTLYTHRPSQLLLPDQPRPSGGDQARLLLEELAELSTCLMLDVRDVADAPDDARAAGIERVPGLELRSARAAGRLRFLGLPSGYEFSTLIADIVDLSRGGPTLSPATLQDLGELKEPVHIQVFGTPT